MYANRCEFDIYHSVVVGAANDHSLDDVLCIPGIRGFFSSHQDLAAEQSDAGYRRRGDYAIYAAIYRKCGPSNHGRDRLSRAHGDDDDADHRPRIQRHMAGGATPSAGQSTGGLSVSYTHLTLPTNR